jgi:hypothetical protein
MLISIKWFLVSQFTQSTLTFRQEVAGPSISWWFLLRERLCPNQCICKHLYPIIHRMSHFLARCLDYSSSKNLNLQWRFLSAFRFSKTSICQLFLRASFIMIHLVFKLRLICTKSILKLAIALNEDELIVNLVNLSFVLWLKELFYLFHFLSNIQYFL